MHYSDAIEFDRRKESKNYVCTGCGKHQNLWRPAVKSRMLREIHLIFGAWFCPTCEKYIPQAIGAMIRQVSAKEKKKEQKND